MQLDFNERETIDARILRIDNFSGYNFLDNPGSVSYSVCSYLEAVGYDANGKYIINNTDTDQFFVVKTIMISGVVELDNSTVQSWGLSDQPIFDYVANLLGITLK